METEESQNTEEAIINTVNVLSNDSISSNTATVVVLETKPATRIRGKRRRKLKSDNINITADKDVIKNDKYASFDVPDTQKVESHPTSPFSGVSYRF